MGDIQVGDLVLTPTGESVAVLDVFEPGNKDVYELTFEDGRTTRACGDHIWKVFVNSDWSHVTTESLIVLLDGTSALSIPLVTMDHQSASDHVDVSMRLYLIEQLNKLLGTPLVTELKSEAETFQQLVRSIGGLARLAYNDGKYIVDATLPESDLKLKITDIKMVSNEPVKCIMIDSPEHLYVTDDFIVTHNTITTATLSQLCEPYGRSMVIVPSKDLVLQTEEDYKNVGLDVGVYYGDRKELGKTHTICTWQSLDALDKKTPDQSVLQLAEFIDGVTAVIVDECFDGDMRVLTADKGYIPIKDIVSGDTIINYSEETQEFKVDTVVKTHTNLTKSSNEKMYELEFDNGVTINVTGNHKFLTTTGWVRVDELTNAHDIINTHNHSGGIYEEISTADDRRD